MSNNPPKPPPLQHVWYYQRTGVFDFVEEGPFTDQQLMLLAKNNKLKLDTAIKSPTRTNGSWIKAESIASLGVAINQGKLDAEADKKRLAEDKARAKQELAVITQQQKLEAARAKSIEVERVLANSQKELQSRKSQMAEQQLLPPIQYAQQLPSQYAHQHEHGMQSTTVVIQQPNSNAVPALVNALLWPGVGQMIQGRVFTGLFIIISWFVSLLLMLVLIGFILAPIVWLASIVDACLYKPPPNTITVHTQR